MEPGSCEEVWVRSSVPDPGSGAFLTPGAGIWDPGWVKSQDPDLGSGSGMSLETIFWVKLLKFFDADPG